VPAPRRTRRTDTQFDGDWMKRTRSKMKMPHVPDTAWTTLEFHSSLDRAREIECEILSHCEKQQFGEEDLFAVKLALEEALVNAVKHGNKLDPSKTVRVLYHISPQRADITIEDQGTGFNPAALPDCCADENLECTSGRGLLLMRAYMNSVVYNPQGNKVTMSRLNKSFRHTKTAALG